MEPPPTQLEIILLHHLIKGIVLKSALVTMDITDSGASSLIVVRSSSQALNFPDFYFYFNWGSDGKYNFGIYIYKIGEASEGQIDMQIKESGSTVVINLTDRCKPTVSSEGLISYQLSRDGNQLEANPKESRKFVDLDVQFFDDYIPGTTYRYCATYRTSGVFSFLNGKQFCHDFVVPWVGTLEGFVRSPPTNIGSQAGIQDVTICAYLKEDFEARRGAFDCVTTELDGSYKLEIQEEWSAGTKNFKLIPSFQDHQFFTSGFKDIQSTDYSVLYRGSKTANFIDNSTVAVTGVVRILDSSCGVGQVSIFKDFSEIGKTEDNGEFALAFSIGESPAIRFALLFDNRTESDHVFDPPSFQIPTLLGHYALPVVIKDVTTREIELSAVAGGNCGAYVASGPISYSVRDCSFSFPPLQMPGVDFRRSLRVPLPAHRVILSLQKDNLGTSQGVDAVEVVQFLEETRQERQSFDLRFREEDGSTPGFKPQFYAPARIEFSSVPFNLLNSNFVTAQNLRECTRDKLGVDGLVNQQQEASLRFRVFETYGLFRCNTQGSVTVQDYVSSLSNSPEESTFELDGSPSYRYVLIPKKPTILEPFTKMIQVQADVDYEILGKTGSVRTVRIVSLAILGYVAPESTFTARTRELPIMILRDPPGGNSYTELAEGSTLTSTFSLSAGAAGNWEMMGEALVGFGLKTSIGAIVGSLVAATSVDTDTELTYQIGASSSLGYRIQTSFTDTLEFEIEALETITTSMNLGLAGEKGDLLAGFAIIVRKGIATTLTVVPDEQLTCRFDRTQALEVAPLSAAPDTYYLYTHNFVENTLIPNIQTAIELSSGDDRDLFEEDLRQWELILREKANAKRRSLQGGKEADALFEAFSEEGEKFFSKVGADISRHDRAPPVQMDHLAFVGALAAYSATQNHPQRIAAKVLRDYLNDFTEEIYSQGGPSNLGHRLSTLRDLFNQAKSEHKKASSIYREAIRRISFDGGIGGFEQSISISRKKGLEMAQEKERSNSLSIAKSSVEIDTPGLSFGGSSDLPVSSEVLRQDSTGHFRSTHNTVTFFLQDPNPADSFVVDLYEDLEYGVPIFQMLDLSSTSCPHEPGSTQIQRPKVQVRSPTRIENIPPHETVFIELAISNAGPGTTEIGYQFEPETLQDLQIKIQGQPVYGQIFSEDIGNYSIVPVYLEISKGPKGRIYEGVRFEVFSLCEAELAGNQESGLQDYIHDFVELDLIFDVSCYEAEWHQSFLPLRPATQQDSLVSLVALVPEYDPAGENNATGIQFLYRRSGQTEWRIAGAISGPPSEASNSYRFDWQVSSNLDQGLYELMFEVTCESYSSSSEIVHLLIDMDPFQAYGVVSPMDRPLKKGESIVVAFNKELDCPMLEASVDGDISMISFQCGDQEVQVKIADSYHDSLMGGDAQVEISARSKTGYGSTFTFSIDTGINFLPFSLPFSLSLFFPFLGIHSFIQKKKK